MLGRYLYSLLAIALAVAAVSCSKEPSQTAHAPARTLIVYLGGDNNLSAESFQKLDALQQLASQNPIFAEDSPASIFVYHDPATASGATPALFRLCYAQARPQLIESYPAENSASAEVFGRVVSTCMRMAPAPSCGLWLFSHASGWLPQATLTSPKARSVVVDGKNEMDIADLAAAIPDQLFDFIVFEACFMAGVEVAYELRTKTDYILASAAEMLSPGFTDLYAHTIPLLFDPSTQHDMLSAVSAVAQTFYRYRVAQGGVERSATVSVIDTKHLDALARIVQQIAAEAAEFNDITSIQHFDRYTTHRLFFDLEHYMQGIAPASPQKNHLADVLAQAIPYARATPQFMAAPGYNGFEIGRHCGLTCYIEQKQFPLLNHAYMKTAWYRATH